MTTITEATSDGTRPAKSIVLLVVLVVQLALAGTSIGEGSSALLTSLAPLFVTLTIVVGIVTNRLYEPWFLSVLCAGWALLMGVRYALEPATGEAVVGVFVAMLAVYYGFRHARNDDSGDGGSAAVSPES